MRPRHTPDGAGLGLRRALLGPLAEHGFPSADVPAAAAIDFFEIAPENWINVGGALGRQLRRFTERHAFACHGLSLSLGGPAPLDETLLIKIRRLLDAHDIALYSEHLSYCSDDGHLYDLMPIPFTRAAVDWCASRIRRTQDLLGRRIAVENVSYYAAPGREMDEADFLCEVLQHADCDLLLDINNVHVNSVNHGYDAAAFLDAMPGKRIAYYHVAGHYDEEPGLKIDTHGAPVIDPVWNLLDRAYARFGVRPTLLERDFNFPPLTELVAELDHIRALQQRHTAAGRHVARG